MPPTPEAEAASARDTEELKRARDADDLKRVLEALFAKDLAENSRSVLTFLNADRSQLSARIPQHPIEIAGLPNLRFSPGDRVRLGGGGIVIRCTNAKLQALRYALKIPRPSLFEGESEDPAAEHQRAHAEYLKHAPLSHKNVARVFGAGEISIAAAKRPFTLALTAILMEWIEDAEPLEKYLASHTLDYLQFVDLVTQAFDGLDHIHARHLIHWDTKSDNLLVDASGTVKITDLGNSRRSDDPARDLTALSTRHNLPPSLQGLIPEESREVRHSFRRTPIELPDLSWDDPWVDMWMLARELSRFLDCEADQDGTETAPRRRFLATCFPEDDDGAQLALASLRLITARLQHPQVPSDERYYRQANAVVHDLRKLTPEFGAAQTVPELQAIPQRVMRLPNTGNAPYSPRVGRLFNCRLVQRLSRHYQLGTIAQVYPGATHRRSEHVAGVMATTAQYVRALFADRTDPFWRLSIEAMDIDALLVAALLHDVGHIAFGHFLEEMSGLMRGRMHEDYVLAMVAPARCPVTEQGQTTREGIEQDREILLERIAQDWVAKNCKPVDFLTYVGKILRPPEGERAVFADDAQLLPLKNEELKIQVLHSIIDSAIDADKIDYLLRDGYHCGVKYGHGIDLERFFQSLTTVTHLDARKMGGNGQRPQRRATVAVTPKGIIPVESLLVSRYQMFNSVYWHHTARAETSMLQFLVRDYVSGRAEKETGHDGHGEAREAQMHERLEALIEKFRNLSDRQALEWLRDNLVRQKPRKALLGSLCEGLLGDDRRKLYWEAFVLRYERKAGGEAKSVYKSLMAISDEVNSANSLSGYIAESRLLRSQFTALMSARLNTRRRRLKFDDGEVLIDIPPGGADQIENVFVNDKSRIKAIQELSPIADAVRDTFGLWARKVRVFMAPAAWQRCLAVGITAREVADSCWWAMIGIARQREPQLKIAFPAHRDGLEAGAGAAGGLDPGQ
jgi:HD superfamily phosphohydrolase